MYSSIGGGAKTAAAEAALLWLLNLSDGRHSVASIVARSGLAADEVMNAVERLMAAGLLAPLPGEPDETTKAYA